MQGKMLMRHFESDLAIVEIVGKSTHVERVFFPVDPSQRALWKSPHFQKSRELFLQTVERENVKLKHAQFVEYCEDTIFEMKQTTRLLGPTRYIFLCFSNLCYCCLGDVFRSFYYFSILSIYNLSNSHIYKSLMSFTNISFCVIGK